MDPWVESESNLGLKRVDPDPKVMDQIRPKSIESKNR